ncbi:MAG: quinone oxidoreductase [Alphaproteobacteria bacterium]|nr:quinone oxidoreductase [Alphaproteobacteria bacterium]
MAKVIRIHAPGGAEVLQLDDLETRQPAAGEVLLRQTAVGLNYIDVYHRIGLYPLPYPSGIGLEGAGVVEAVGEGVTRLKVGDRVAYGGGPVGAYAEYRTMPETYLVKLPDAISDVTAAAVMVQGLTAQFLVRRTFPITAEHTVLIHAAAGGVGVLLSQWAKHLGATVIGTVSSEEKAELARKNGCDHIIFYTHEDVAVKVRELTGGKGVHVVYDSVGKDTFQASLNSLRPLGMLVSFGQASGAIPPFDILQLSQKGSLFVTRPSMMDYVREPAEYHASADELLALLASGVLKVHVGQTYALQDVAKAHAALESRKTQGATVLLTTLPDDLDNLAFDGG